MKQLVLQPSHGRVWQSRQQPIAPAA